MSTVRLLPPPNTSVVRHNIVQKGPSGKTFDGTANAVVDAEPHDARILIANGWIPVSPDHSSQSGATAARPTTGLYQGLQFMDTTLGFLITWDGVNWRRPDTGAVA